MTDPLIKELADRERALSVARTALESDEHGADTAALETAYVSALRARNSARRYLLRGRRPATTGGCMIVTLEGRELIRFHDMIRDLDNMINDGSVEVVRIMIDAEGVKAKPGRATWSPGYGELEVS